MLGLSFLSPKEKWQVGPFEIGHDTTDLFKWSKRFDSDEQLRFTWLLSPRTIDGRLPWLPYLALASGLLTIVAMMGVLGREGIGPMGGIMSQRKPSLEEE